jgi:SH3-like domain-containing protein
MRKLLAFKKHGFNTVIVLLICAFMSMFYLVNTRAVNHEVEMMFVSSGEKTLIIQQANNFRFINETFGEETARLNYITIMQDGRLAPEVKKIVRLAYAEYLKD